MAVALTGAAVSVFVIAVIAFYYLRHETGRGDWLGWTWFAIVPLLVAAVICNVGADRLAGDAAGSPPESESDGDAHAAESLGHPS